MSVVFTPSARRYGQAALGLCLALAVFSCAKREPAPSTPATAPEASPAAAPPAERDEDKASEAPAPAAPGAQAVAPPTPAPAPARQKDALSERRAEESEGNFAEPPPTNDLRTAEADLERYRRELEAALSPARARPAPTGGAAASRGAAADDAPASPAKKAGDGGCSTACRAFSSLGRAASAVCRLAGEKDARCTRAHGVVAEAEKRVAACGCRAE